MLYPLIILQKTLVLFLWPKYPLINTSHPLLNHASINFVICVLFVLLSLKLQLSLFLSNVYYIEGEVLTSIDNFNDLGVICSATTSHAGHYKAYYQQVITKAAQVSRLIRRTFRSMAKELLWTVFEIFLILILMQCSPIWSPILKRDINALESIPRRFTKCICGQKDFSYDDRLI